MFRLTTDPIDFAALRTAASAPAAGAVVLFDGTVRNHHLGRSVDRLEYEAHEAVANKEGRKIMEEAVARFDLQHAQAVHRIGALQVEESAVVVVVSTAHRAEAFEACRFLIDEIKRRVPIWKKEYYADGSVEWVGCEGCAGHHAPHTEESGIRTAAHGAPPPHP